MFEKNHHLHQSPQLFQQKNCSVQELFENGVRIFLAAYNAPTSEDDIDSFRYTQFIKSTRLNKPVQLSSVPPSSAAAGQHIIRVYYQTQIWLGNDLEPQEFGWVMQNEFLEPITTLLPPAPEELLNTIFCNCKKSCGSNCGCRKSGLQCTLICGQCNGQSCLNASSTSDDFNEESEYAPDILEYFYSDTLINENDDDESDIEQSEEEEEEDDEEEN
ncbi:uncharacterized protein [Diabrotica undecimpunctata]|uniref:uncharacterized protein n=1 Tax=Diabrotica undecimpunctata TaxID=50387 RepID=UPI003B642592